MMSIGKRLVALGFHISREKAQLKIEIQGRLHQMLGCLAEAIEWMHTNNVRHRDLKLANILLRPGQILLTDFGISRHQVVGETTSTETDVGFTWGYAAPEVFKKDGIASLARADVYSLGCVFLHIFMASTSTWDAHHLISNSLAITIICASSSSESISLQFARSRQSQFLLIDSYRRISRKSWERCSMKRATPDLVFIRLMQI